MLNSFLSKLWLLCLSIFIVVSKNIVPEASLLHSRYLNLDELAVEDIIWIDGINSLRNATCHIEGCKVVGLDCEWKPNYIKGSKPSKVIITDFLWFIVASLSISFSLLTILDSLIVLSYLALISANHFIYRSPRNIFFVWSKWGQITVCQCVLCKRNDLSLSGFQVSIMQIASDKMVFILDLIKLFEDAPDILDNCLTRILQSPRILKLGM